MHYSCYILLRACIATSVGDQESLRILVKYSTSAHLAGNCLPEKHLSLSENYISGYEQEQTCFLLRLAHQSVMFCDSCRLCGARKAIYRPPWRTGLGNKAVFKQASNALLSWDPWLPHHRDDGLDRLSNRKIGKEPRHGYPQRKYASRNEPHTELIHGL